MSLDLVAVALGAGLVGGAVGGIAIGAVQAWMARGRGTRAQWFGQRLGPPAAEATRVSRSTMSGMGPFDRFNESAKRVLSLAQDEAIRQNHNYIGTEHLLAAIVREGDTIAARALQSFGIDLTKVRTALEFIIGRGDQTMSPSEITLSPRTKKVIELAIDESRRMGWSYVGAEHILLGVVREGEGIASGIIESLGATLPMVRARVLELLAAAGTPTPANYAAPPPRGGHTWGPFTRFGDRAKNVLAFAQDEAIRMGHGYIGPEHLLLGLGRLVEMAQPDEAMKLIFGTLAITLEQLRAELGKVIPAAGRESLPTEITLSPETKEIIQIVNDSTA
ncbi:MAG TPA: Clp protease N-terminal domain-containing protein, partial [Candidatus Bathyarchaeia archaeon]|nr:Clp protease N-terminal domain-containing protein [Candidatus Bathyarchaeia archaeon]